MKITKYPQSCFILQKGNTRILVDPGGFCFDYISDFQTIDALLYTHKHGDHYDAEIYAQILQNNPGVQVYVPQDFPLENVSVFKNGIEVQVGEISIVPRYEKHLEIYGEFGQVPLVTLAFDRTVFFSSDTFVIPDFTPSILLFPVGGPFMSLREAIDYVKEVNPKVAIPMHEAVLSKPGLAGHIKHLKRETSEVEIAPLETQESY